MSFYPQVNDEIELNGIIYRFSEHPAAPIMPYGLVGQAATVYQLERADDPREKLALKVLKPRFRVPAMVSLSQKMNEYATLPGLEVCSRSVLTLQANPDLLGTHPDLLYSIVMPWVFGPTWMDVIIDRLSVTQEQSLEHATALVGVLSEMEQQGLAHCDLSGPNVLLPCLSQEDVQRGSKVALVDVEQLYAPNLRQPSALPGGSPGYAHHRDSPEGLWSDDADRFAGGVLLAEMLAWCEPGVRKESWSESFFAPDEMQQLSDRYHLMLKALRERWGEEVSRLFERVWTSGTLRECPTFGEWFLGILRNTPQSVTVLGAAGTQRKKLGKDSQAAQKVESLLTKARTLEDAGNPKDALTAYREARQAAPEGSALERELASIVNELEKQAPSSPSNTIAKERAQAYLQLAQQAEERGDLEMAMRSYRQAAELTPDDSLKREIETILRTLEPKVGPDLAGAPPRKLIERAQELEEEGRTEEAVRFYQRAVTKLPAGSSQAKELSIILRQLGATVPEPAPPEEKKVAPPPVPEVKKRNLRPAFLALSVVAFFAFMVEAWSEGYMEPIQRRFQGLFADSGQLSVTATLPDAAPSGGGNTITNPTDGTVLVKVPAGPFTMGSNDGGDDEKPPHQVSLPTFYIAKTEVTNAQFRKFVDATGYDAGDDWKECAEIWGDQGPVVCVSWDDADAYCRWAGLRLPTEQEWEKAARGTDGRTYPWGNSFDTSRAWCTDNSPFQAHSVGSKPGGASPYGALDMAGNAWEWTDSWYQAYPGGASNSLYGTQYKVVRGGSWVDNAYRLRSTIRDWTVPTIRIFDLGFRCARTP